MIVEPPVMVIGAGIVGICCALQLQRCGVRVAVIDPRSPGEATSGGNAGLLAVGEVVPLSLPGTLRALPRWLMDPLGPLAIRWSYLPRLAPWLVRFVRAGRPCRVAEISRAMANLDRFIVGDHEPLLAEAGIADMLVREPHLRLYESRAQFEAEAYKARLREQAGVQMEIVEGYALRALEPDISPRFNFGVVLKERYHVTNPRRMVECLAAHVVRRGGEVIADEVVGFEHDGDRVTALRLRSGAAPSVSTIVLAAGIWSRPLAGLLGDRVPMESERGYHVMVPNPGVRLTRSVSHPAQGFVMTPMEGGLRLAGTIELGGLDAAPDYRRARILLRKAKAVLPALNEHAVDEWMGHRPSMPDSLPVIGRARRVRNVFYAFGHGHMGLSWAATTGRLIARLVAEQPLDFDLSPYRADRF